MKIEITLTEATLGTLAGNPEIAKEFIMSKHPDGIQQDELHAETPEGDLAKACTIFPRENGKPFIWDYQIKGFFKEACIAMIETDTITQEELKAVRLTKYLFKRTIDRKIHENWNAELSGEICWCERPLRGMTMQGERISMARSEEIPAGSKFSFEIICMNKKLLPYIMVDLRRTHWSSNGVV
jgi:hypothetical protein